MSSRVTCHMSRLSSILYQFGINLALNMGQKHQAFLIARVIPKGKNEAKYRCIGGIHHRWLYGISPPMSANRLIRLLRQPQNAMIIREEIKTLHGKYGRRGETPEIPQIPAPYSMFLLMSAYNTDMDSERPFGSSSGFMLEAFVGSTESDNNDGITVIDVTDPENPHYCFIHFNNLLRILSANSYARGYFPLPSPPEFYTRDADRPQTPPDGDAGVVRDPEFNEQIEDLIAQFTNVKLIEPHMLAEAWPDEYDFENPSDEPALSREKDAERQPQAVPPLVQMSLKLAITSAVENDQLDTLDHFLSNPTTRHTIKQLIMENPSLQSISAALLSEIVAKELECDSTATIDFSDFTLTSEQIADILISHQNIYSLNLSRNPNVVGETLEYLLANFPKLHRLILFDTGITRDDIVALLKLKSSLFYRISALIHPALLNHMDEDLAWVSDFGHWCYDVTSHSSMASGITLPFFSPTQVVQTTISTFAASRRASKYQEFFDSPYFFQAAYSAEYREESKRLWDDRLVSVCPQDNPKAALLRLHGWLFLWSKPEKTFSHFPRRDWNQSANNSYAWIRFNSKAVENCKAVQEIQNPVQKGLTAIEVLGNQLFEVYDLRGFLDACEAEGRPSIPDNLRKTAFIYLEQWKTADPKAESIQTFRPMVSASDVLEAYKAQLKKLEVTAYT